MNTNNNTTNNSIFAQKHAGQSCSEFAILLLLIVILLIIVAYVFGPAITPAINAWLATTGNGGSGLVPMEGIWKLLEVMGF